MIIKRNLDIYSSLIHIRKNSSESIPFPFIFLDGKDNEIKKGNRINNNVKINSEGKLEYYLYSQFLINTIQKECSTNIMVFGETGVGKSIWIHALLNYIENIKIEENVRHLLFDEKEMQKKKMKRIRSTAKKQKGVVLQMNLFLLIFIQMNILLIKIQLK